MAASTAVTFQGSQGVSLAARLDRPAGKPHAYALFAHCFTCSKDSLAAARISSALTAHGIAVLRFDFTGLGGSQGDFSNSNFSSNIEDLVAAIDYLRREHEAPRLLVGHSLGGAAVLAAAHHAPEAVAVATLGAPYDPAHVRHLLGPSVAEIEARGESLVTLGGRQFRVQRQFLDDLDAHNSRDAIARLRKALLVMHSPLDTTVDVDNAAQIFAAAKHPKSFISLADADHLLTRQSDATYVATVLAAWASRYIASGAAAPASSAIAPPGTVIVSETGTGKFAQTVLLGNHRLSADEPVASGGTDSGPSPYELLLAALGACTSMTLRLYADHKGIALQRVAVRLKHEKIHAQDCVDCETREGKIDRIEREIELHGELSGAEREKLLEIANKCPVHRTLQSEVTIPTRLAPE